MFLIKIIIIIFIIGANSEVTDLNLNKGVVFLHQGNYLMTTSRWTLVIDIPMDPLDTQLAHLQEHVQFLDQFIESTGKTEHRKDSPIAPLWDISRKEILHLRHMLQNFQQEVNDIKSLVTVPREKRALVDLGGKVLKFLFGVATTDEFSELSNKIDSLGVRQQKISHILEAQASVLNQTLNIVRDNSDRIQILTDRQTRIQGHLLAYQYAFYTGSSLRFVESAFAEFRSQLALIREAIDVLGQGHLSSYFASREILLQTLKSIHTSLPAEFALIEAPNKENLFKFYKWITVTSAALPNKLRIFAEIPLVTPEGFFDLYEIFKLPAYFTEVSSYVFYQTKFQYIALSKNRQSYMLLNSNDIFKCKTDTIAMCSPEVPILKPPVQACEYALFLGQDIFINKFCEKRISNNYSPIFRRINMQGDWIYSTPIEISLIIRCPKGTEILKTQSKIIKITNTGFFTLPMICSGYAPGMKLTSYFQSKSLISVSLDVNVVIPPITEVLNKVEHEIIKSFNNLSMIEREEKTLPNHALPLELASISLKEIQKQLTSLKSIGIEKPNGLSSLSEYHFPSIIGSTSTILIIIVIVIISYFLIKRKRKVAKQSAPVVIFQPDTSGNLETEQENIPLKEINVTDKTSAEDTEESASAPISFRMPRI